MKHDWKITKRGRKSKWFTCQRCNLVIIANSRKMANDYPKCHGKVKVAQEAE